MRKIVSTILVLLMLALSACSSPSAVTTTAEPTSQDAAIVEPTAAATQTEATTSDVTEAASATTALDITYENAVSVEMQLLLGTLSLSGDLAVTEEQAGVLLPLWSELRTLSMGARSEPGAPNQAEATPEAGAAPQSQAVDSETQVQIDTLVAQIEAAMTGEQVAAIAAMQITQDSAITIAQNLGINGGGGGQSPAGTPPADVPQGDRPSDGEQPGGGQAPEGTPPAGVPQGDRPSDGGQMGGAFGGGISPELFDALIRALGGTPAASVAAPSAPAGTGASTGTATIAGAYTQTGGSETKTGGTYTASETDQSAVYVTGDGILSLTDAAIVTEGDSSSTDESSFYGLNAAVLANDASQITLSDSTISTTGTGANGAFAEGAGSSVTLSNVTIQATGNGGHGVMATNGGLMTLTNVDMTTAGVSSGAIATDRGSGTILVTGGTVTTSGQNSPGIYSTGVITVTGATISASGAESAVIEGANSITLVDTDLSSSKADKWGVMIYQSMSGDAEGTRGVFTMKGGTLADSATTGPLFYVNNSTGVITLEGVKVTAASGILLDASANSQWGVSGSNGGNAILTAIGQTLAGDMTADTISTLAITLQDGSSLTGAINTAHTAKAANLTLDATSTWNVTADAYLTCLSGASISGTTVTNIIGNGYTVYYDVAACAELGGQTYSLSGGGTLQPAL